MRQAAPHGRTEPARTSTLGPISCPGPTPPGEPRGAVPIFEPEPEFEPVDPTPTPPLTTDPDHGPSM